MKWKCIWWLLPLIIPFCTLLLVVSPAIASKSNNWNDQIKYHGFINSTLPLHTSNSFIYFLVVFVSLFVVGGQRCRSTDINTLRWSTEFYLFVGDCTKLTVMKNVLCLQITEARSFTYLSFLKHWEFTEFFCNAHSRKVTSSHSNVTCDECQLKFRMKVEYWSSACDDQITTCKTTKVSR